MGLRKESISKFVIGNWLHVKLRILNPKLQAKLTGEKLSSLEVRAEKANKLKTK